MEEETKKYAVSLNAGERALMERVQNMMADDPAFDNLNIAKSTFIKRMAVYGAMMIAGEGSINDEAFVELALGTIGVEGEKSRRSMIERISHRMHRTHRIGHNPDTGDVTIGEDCCMGFATCVEDGIIGVDSGNVPVLIATDMDERSTAMEIHNCPFCGSTVNVSIQRDVE